MKQLTLYLVWLSLCNFTRLTQRNNAYQTLTKLKIFRLLYEAGESEVSEEPSRLDESEEKRISVDKK